LRGVFREYWQFLQREQLFYSWHLGACLYLLLVQVPCLLLAHPDGKSQVLLIAGFPFSGCVTLAWVRLSTLRKTVSRTHETIEGDHQ
jgi:hypothetical protein